MDGFLAGLMICILSYTVTDAAFQAPMVVMMSALAAPFASKPPAKIAVAIVSVFIL